jgi:hypothetical protein
MVRNETAEPLVIAVVQLVATGTTEDRSAETRQLLLLGRQESDGHSPTAAFLLPTREHQNVLGACGMCAG